MGPPRVPYSEAGFVEFADRTWRRSFPLAVGADAPGADLPAYDADVHVLAPMPDLATARAQLAEIAAHGIPADALVPGDRLP